MSDTEDDPKPEDLLSVCVTIGNSDDKLSQLDWSNFTYLVDHHVENTAWEIHFRGFTPSQSRYQTAAWTFTIRKQETPTLRAGLAMLADKFKQDSIAWMSGPVEFIKPEEDRP